MDTLIKALERRGFTVHVRSGKEAGTVVKIGEDEIPIRLDERTTRVERKAEPGRWLFKRYEFLPTGRLALQIDWYGRGNFQKVWTDGKEEKLEARLDGFVVSLLVAAEEEKERRLERERWHRDWEAGQAAREEARRRQEEERARADAVEKRLAAWEKSVRLREFAAAVEERVNAEGNDQERLRLGIWLAWVRRHADQLDPVLHRNWLTQFEGVAVRPSQLSQYHS